MSFWFAPLLDSAAATAGGVNGAASGQFVVTGASSGAVSVAGSSSGSISLTGSATATAQVSGGASGSIDLTGSAAGTVGGSISGDISGSVSFTGAATGTVSIFGAVSGLIDFSGSATGTGPVQVVVARGDDAFASSGARERFWARKAEEWLEEHLPDLKEAAQAPKAKRKRIARAVIADVIEAPAPYRPQINAALEIARRLLAPDYTALAMQVAAELAAIEAVRTQIRRRRDMEAVLLLVA